MILYIMMLTILTSQFADAALGFNWIQPQQVPQSDDGFRNLGFRSEPFANLKQFDSPRFRYAEVNFRPWSGSFWPTSKGMLAHRYHDPHFPGSTSWRKNYDYYITNNSETLLSQKQLDRLSPAEKYDLLVGDPSWSLTQAMWNKGIQAAKQWGDVPAWFGICHGWSAAIHMRVSEPLHRVVAVNPNGVEITFYPNDIKALTSYLWAASSPGSLFIGSKCRTPNPERDEWGRVKDPRCLDSNPMTWHLSVLNRVGRDGDSLIMDSSMNNEIWNYAIDSYSLRYFNPSTLKPSRSWEDTLISTEQYFSDPFKNHRTTATRYIVGVVMTAFFPAAIKPKAMGKVGQRIYKSKTFVYDLELDEDLNIIGGEWHSKERPDFLWTYRFDASAGAQQMVSDVSHWSHGHPLPADLATRAQQFSKRGLVTARIVNALIEKSLLTNDQQNGDYVEEEPVEIPGGQEDPGDDPGPQTPGG